MKKSSNRKDYCYIMADRIHKTNPSLLELENTLNDIYEKAYKDGYNDSTGDAKQSRERRDAIIKKQWNCLRDDIEDKIHQNK